ncbi:MAG: hypothetical protein H0T08_08780 [Acidobacteria bacterium]|jgi:ABC-type sugar transport system substrate-binding protein|nr:hypothetical protein [Acidobacteriota bacterium]
MKIKLLFLIVSLLFAFNCNQSATNSNSGNASTGNTAAKKRIGVSLLTREDDFYRTLEAGLQEAARQNNFELIVQSGDKDLSK